MICEKCYNDYPSTYYFATPTICKSCFLKLPEDEKQRLAKFSKAYTTEQTLELRTGFGKRFLASLVDTLILLAIILAFFKFSGFLDSYFNFFQELKEFGGNPQELQEHQNHFFKQNALNFAFPAILYLVYFLPEVFLAFSLGKYFLGLKIGSTTGEQADSHSLWLRYIVKNFGSIMMLLWVVTQLSIFNVLNSICGLAVMFGFLLILGRNKQNLQDILAKTAVYPVEFLEKVEKTNE